MPSWLGWHPFMFQFIGFANWLMSRFGGKKMCRSALFKTPLDKKQKRVAKTAAEFLSILDSNGIPYNNG